MEAETALLK